MFYGSIIVVPNDSIEMTTGINLVSFYHNPENFVVDAGTLISNYIYDVENCYGLKCAEMKIFRQFAIASSLVEDNIIKRIIDSAACEFLFDRIDFYYSRAMFNQVFVLLNLFSNIITCNLANIKIPVC